jgi:hypothetical protein
LINHANWDDRERDYIEEANNSGVNFNRHSMECPNCRSNTWSFMCFIPDFKTGRIMEGCNECNQRAKKIWDRENIKASTAVTCLVICGIACVGFVLGFFLR